MKNRNHERSSDQTIMNISLPKQLKEEIRKAAAKEHRSMSSFIAYQISQHIKEQKGKK